VTPAKIGFFKNVIVVASSGGDYASPVDAMNAITDASASKLYLVKIMPGVYNIGSNKIQMKAYVDIAGSGENVTIINGTSTYGSGVVEVSSTSEIRQLSVYNTGSGAAINITGGSPKITNIIASTITVSGQPGYGIYTGSSSPTIMNVTATSSGGNAENSGIRCDYSSNVVLNNVKAAASGGGSRNCGIYLSFSSAVLNNVESSAADGTISLGIYIDSNGQGDLTNVKTSASNASQLNYGVFIERFSSAVLTNVVANGSGPSFGGSGVFNAVNCTMKIKGSTIAGAYNGGGTLYIGSSEINGTVSGNAVCAGVYDQNYIFYANTCP
jgi:hypothetical protein